MTFKVNIKSISQLECLSATEKSRLDNLNVLASLLLRPCIFRDIVQNTLPIIPDLCARWNSTSFNYVPCNKHHTNHLSSGSPKHMQDGELIKNSDSDLPFQMLMTYARLVPLLPYLKTFCLSAMSSHFTLLDTIDVLNTTEFSKLRYRNMMQSIYRLVSFSVQDFNSCWNTTKLYEMLEYPDYVSRWYAASALALLLGMSDKQSTELINKCIPKLEQQNVLVHILQDRDQTHQDKLMLFQKNEEYSTKLDVGDFSQLAIEDTVLDSSNLSPYTVDVCGVVLPHESLYRQDATKKGDANESDFVVTPKCSKVLHEMAIAMSCELPILLEGFAGVGKTAIVEAAGKMVGSRELLKIHLGDQTDSKLLLGTYMTGATPGTFKWQQGVLTTAVREGRWILIEDIDLAPVDVIAILLPLLETRWLHIPSRGERHRAKDGFRIFATRRALKPHVSNHTDFPRSVGENLWAKIYVPVFTGDEIDQILHSRFPNLRPILPLIHSVYERLCVLAQENALGRNISIRDLIKWCTRVDRLNPHHDFSNTNSLDEMQVREILFREGFDCFSAMIPNQKILHSFTLELGNVLELSEHRIQYYLDHHIPVVNVDSDSVQFGRVSIKKNTATVPKDESKFATTTPSIRLLERLAVCCALNEPVLLVGETGTGKTTVVQRLSAQLGHRLIVINMSQQSDSTDLLGGFKPVDALMLATPLKEKFDALFSSTFSVKQNGPFLDSIKSTFIRKKWDALIVGFRNAIKMAEKVAKQQKATQQIGDSNEKKKKVRKILDSSLFIEWENFSNMVNQFHAQMNQIKSNFLFFFVEGSLVKAIREGYWILLDEINLATAETLECLSGLLQSDVGSVMLLERGDTTPIARHPNFRLFACMNPATDAGKRNLPNGLRSRFTEFWVDSPDSNLSDLLLIIKTYLFGHLPPGSIGEQLCHDIAKFYKGAKELSVNGLLFDGADQRVHVSMRTLTRALSCASFAASVYGVRRSLYEGCYMTFMTGLGAKSFDQMLVLLSENILNGVSNPTSFIKQIPPNPSPNHTDSDTTSPYSLVECFWLEKGQYEIPEDIDSLFVLTPSVKANLCNLARGCLSRKYPVLIQGPTSAGKTSMIEYLAKRTGHRFIRINNHEHTDLQEYLGSYMSNDQGVLVFQEGVLVEALRKGYWIVLDELNLAPSDVLEALNRLLDDNRELFLPEKQEVIKPHPHFMLFATQNPAGQYGGRKQLSRAFRNRFLELHFSDIPECELETIIEKRCLIPPSYAKKCVAVYRQLCKSRDASRIFDGRQSFITLRDLFRWALRRANGYENLAQDGYMLIAERVRNPADREVIQRIIEKELKVKLNMSDYYTNQFDLIQQNLKDVYTGKPMPKVVWTQAMQKLFVLIYNATIHQEPVLLIGETGCGKTTVCQVLSALFDQELHIVNAHQNSETADFLGSQRPARGRDVHEVQLRKLFNELLIKVNDLSDIDIEASSLANLETLYFKLKDSHAGEFQKEFEELFKTLVKAKSLFEWCDGPLIQAMKKGDMFLLDEISLADDSVLERLNSVLEPGRSLTLVEKSGLNVDEIKANEKFHFFATMNPGGDYGKKELSPALRNRFTELWVPQVSNREDLHLIITDRLEGIQCPKEWATKILQFLEWLAETLHKPVKSIISLRDVLAWASFILSLSHNIGVKKSYYHGGCMVLVDGIGINPLFGIVVKSKTLVLDAYCKLKALAGYDGADLENVNFVATDSGFGSHPFMVSFGEVQRKEVKFSLNAPTTMQNCLRVLRALQLSKPILLEGSPGAGKTSLVTTLAELSGHPLCRINLSEQTDLMDLFGSDLPVEGGRGGEFAWRDGPFLKAMQTGEWVLLDELNLASQQVLEGLNACLDHRATVYIPELDRHFSCHPNFRVFAAQNPQSQGGGRKGLPKSFINRFSLVYVQELQIDDIRLICQQLYPNLSNELVNRMITFNEQIKLNTMDLHTFGWLGSPWEFNLRDILRWIELLIHSPSGTDPGEYLNLLYVQRMRSQPDREAVRKIYQEVFGHVPEQCMMTPAYRISPNFIKIGSQFHSRKSNRGKHMHGVPADHLQLLPSSLTVFESLLKCVHSKTTALLVGPPGSGKSSAVRLLANICGEKLEEFSLNPGVDALELLGGFEQVDLVRNLQEILDYLGNIVEFVQKDLLLTQKSSKSIMELHRVWNAILGTTNQSECINRCMSLLDSLKQCYAKPEDLSIIEKRISGLIKLINSGVKGQFEWMDSTLINAMEEGSWILIDNVNMCSSSVLDRLNSLLEVGGLLAINERGLVDGEVKIVKPHENFRMFMAMDPRQGEISRAMRNRSIELYICDLDADQNAKLLTSSKAFDEIGLPGSFFANMLDKRLKNCGEIPPLKIKLFLEHLRRGDHYAKSLEELDISSVSNTTFEDIQWRDYASGSLVSHNSQLSHGIVDVSIITRVFEESKDWIGMNSFPIVPPAHVLLKAAVNLYINLTSGSDKHLRMACLDFQVAKFGNDNALEYIKVFHSDRPELLADIERIRESLLVEFGLFDYSNDLPLDIRTVNIYKSGVAQWSQYTYLLEKLLIERSVRHTRTVEEFTYAEAAKCSIQNLNISQLSYLAHSRVIRAGSLHHPSIQYFYPLLETIDEVCLSDDIDILFSKTILNHRSNLWDTLQSKNYEFDQIFVILQGLNDFLKENHIESYLKLPSYEQLKELLERISQSLSLPKFEACSVLWNYNGSKELVKKPLWDIGMALENLNSSMNIWNMNPQEWFVKTSNWTRHVEVKRMIVEAKATLFFLNDQIIMDEELYQVMKTIPEKLTTEGDTAIDVIPSLDLVNQGQQMCTKFLNWPICDVQVIYKELEILTLMIHLYSSKNTDYTKLFDKSQYLLSGAIADSSFPPLHFEPIQRLSWFCDSQQILRVNEINAQDFLTSIYSDFVLQWHQSLWNNGLTFWNTHLYNESLSSLINGEISPLVYQEISIDLEKLKLETKDSLPIISGQSGVLLSMIRDMDLVPVYAIDSKQEQLASLQGSLSEMEFTQDSVLNMDNILLIESLRRFIVGHASFLDTETIRIVDDQLSSISSSIKPFDLDFQLLSNMILESPDDLLSSYTKSKVEIVIKNLPVLINDPLHDHHALRGYSWVCLALAVLNSYIPDFPTDPVEIRRAKILFLNKKLNSLEAEILIDCEQHYLNTGQIPNLDELHKLWNDLNSEKEALLINIPLRPAVSQIHELFSELKNLKTNILNPANLESLCNALLTPNLDSVTVSFNKEASFQGILDSIISRLKTNYPLYTDLTKPIFQAVYFLKYGLRLLRNKCTESRKMKKNDLLNEMILFITSYDIDSFQSMLTNINALEDGTPTAISMKLKFFHALLDRAYALQYNQPKSMDTVNPVHEIFNSIVDLWTVAEEQRLLNETKENSLYQVKEHIIQTQDEYDDEEFQKQFRDFHDDFIDLNPPELNDDDVDIKSREPSPYNAFDNITCSHISNSFQRAVCKPFTSKTSVLNLWEGAYRSSFTVLSIFAKQEKLLPSSQTDTIGRPGYLYMVNARLEDVRNPLVLNSIRPYDFYNDSNMNEAKKIKQVLLKYESVLNNALTQWPDHTVLNNLANICRRVISFPITSPLMKFLTGLEILLIKSEDWEAYSSKEYSLKSVLNDVVKLIIEWRKLELDTWRDLLAIEDRKCSDKVGQHWFHLWKIINGALIKSQETDPQIKESFHQQLLQVLDEFCLTSTLGEFKARLQLLESFRLYIEGLNSDLHYPHREMVQNMLWNVIKYYGQFSDVVNEKLELLRKPILKELREYVKIATWKDVNTFALKESAKRTHYHLNKFVKKYRQGLQFSIKETIATYLENIPNVSKGNMNFESVVNRLRDSFPHFISTVDCSSLAYEPYVEGRLGDLTKLHHKSKSIMENLLSQTNEIDICLAIDELGETVLQRIVDFQSINSTIRAGSNNAKGQKMLRKKAWVDLLKHLHFVGLKSRCSQKYIKQQDPMFLQSRLELNMANFSDLINQSSHFSLDLKSLACKADSYFYRSLSRLGTVRKLASGFSPDITSLEVEKCISFLDHICHLQITHRSLFSKYEKSLRVLNSVADQIKPIVEKRRTVSYGQCNISTKLSAVRSKLHSIVVCLEQTLLALKSSVSKSDFLISFDTKIKQSLDLFNAKIVSINEFNLGELNLIPTNCMELFLASSQTDLNQFLEYLQSLRIQNNVEILFILEPLISNVSKSVEIVNSTLGTTGTSKMDLDLIKRFKSSLSIALDSSLITIQSCLKPALLDLDEVNEEFGMKAGDILNAHTVLSNAFVSGKYETLSERLAVVLNDLVAIIESDDISIESKANATTHMLQFYPIINQVILMLNNRLSELMLFHKATSKLQYILSNTFYTILKNGFCVPQEEAEDENDDGETEDNVAGMGIGEGDGKKDVSDEIENEDQVQGLQNEDSKPPPPDQKKIDEEDNGIEMEDDFNGALEDVEPDENVDDDNENDEGDDEEADEQMGDLDDLGDTVDEKMWGDDEKPDGGDKEEKNEKDSGIEANGAETEMAAQENPTNESESPETKEETPQKKEKENDTADTNENEDGPINEDTEDKYEENQGLEVKPADGLDVNDEIEDDDDNMEDLPDEMNLDGDDDMGDDNPIDDDGMLGEEDGETDNKAEEPDQQPTAEDLGDQIPELDELNQNTEAEDHQDRSDPEDDDIEAENDDDDGTKGTNVHGGEEAMESDPECEDGQDEDDKTPMDNPNENNNTESSQPFGIEGESGVKSTMQDNLENNGADSNDADANEAEANQPDGEKSRSNRTNTNADTTKNQEQKVDSNPHRSLGSALEKWHARLRNIADSTNEVSQKADSLDDEENGNEFEFVNEDDDDQGTTQALGIADAHQMEQAEPNQVSEEEANNESTHDEMDVDEPDTTSKKDDSEILNQDFKSKSGKVSFQPEKQPSESDAMDVDDVVEDNVKAEIETDETEVVKAEKDTAPTFEKDDVIGPVENEEDLIDYDTLRKQLEERMTQWRKDGNSAHEGQTLWRDYTALTQNLAFHLCEQLRLILEPTLTTKLKGDYRTGKRLNMRKIISYIASQFKKDKIWLRRNKPSKRTYQVMIAIDDSLSMSSSHSVQLAFESLTVLTTALSQLEVGDIGVVSFGEEVKLLHPFETAWSDEAGADVIGSFTFSQERTKVKLLMEQSIDILQHSRMLQTATGELWQLQIIISDGICDDHEYIRTRVHLAAEDHICMVFVILDTRSEKDSILNMSNVSYDFDSATGRPILKMDRYMDSFPFDYFVVVRNIEKLPEILADTLRQFFQFVNSN